MKAVLTDRLQTSERPLFPIKMNGHDDFEVPEMSSPGIKTKHFLIQTKARLNRDDLTILQDSEVRELDLVSKNTYLCRSESQGSEGLKTLPPIMFACAYPKELKVHPDVKDGEDGSARLTSDFTGVLTLTIKKSSNSSPLS